ncbi:MULTISPECIES: hypothetical protein [Trichocoleus]|uniref:Uncharacterized protein n=1 Tax=Trichocoleus desertorum GB2-A4 TaxID=2933944 RepID=A0ABV0JFK3_9CYAN|nr:hypothetical protein [Trichocoleus sp. FACHB-46]MBD1863033.1 hypothetical protein [Trichocoleus sp. FACHB-46]
MSNSKFQQLVEMRKLDYQETYTYVDTIFAIITEFNRRFGDYLNCPSGAIDIVEFHSDTGEVQKEGYWRDRIKIDDDCFFRFRLMISLHEVNEQFAGFNTNNSGKHFFEIGLAPPSGMIFGLGIKLKDEQECTIKILNPPKNSPEKVFTINLQQENLFHEVFEFLYQEMRKSMEHGLQGRIDRLTNQGSEAENQFGFAMPVD